MLDDFGFPITRWYQIGIVHAWVIYEWLRNYNLLVHLPAPLEKSKFGLKVMWKQFILELNQKIANKCVVRICHRILLKIWSLTLLMESKNRLISLSNCDMVIFLIAPISEYMSTLWWGWRHFRMRAKKAMPSISSSRPAAPVQVYYSLWRTITLRASSESINKIFDKQRSWDEFSLESPLFQQQQVGQYC